MSEESKPEFEAVLKRTESGNLGRISAKYFEVDLSVCVGLTLGPQTGAMDVVQLRFTQGITLLG